MSVIKFELKKEHLLLLKHFKWCVNKENKLLVSTDDLDESPLPYGADELYPTMDLILNGRPDDFNKAEILDKEELKIYNDSDKTYFDNLYNELPLALEVILASQTFELGSYKCRYHLRDWKRLN